MRDLYDSRVEFYELFKKELLYDVMSEGFIIGADVLSISTLVRYKITKIEIEEAYVMCSGVRMLRTGFYGKHIHQIGEPSYMELVT